MEDVTIDAAKRERAVPPSKRSSPAWIMVVSALALLAGLVTAFNYLT